MKPIEERVADDTGDFLEGVGTAFVTNEGALVVTHDNEALSIELTPAELRGLAADLCAAARRLERQKPERFA